MESEAQRFVPTLSTVFITGFESLPPRSHRWCPCFIAGSVVIVSVVFDPRAPCVAWDEAEYTLTVRGELSEETCFGRP